MGTRYRPTAVESTHIDEAVPAHERLAGRPTSPTHRSGGVTASIFALAKDAVDPDRPGTEIIAEALRVVCGALPGARWAAVHRRDNRGQISTLAASDPTAALIDAEHLWRGTSPSRAALDAESITITEFHMSDQPRTTALTPGVAAPRSALAVPLAPAGHPQVAVVFYADRPDIGSEWGREAARLAAAGLALVLTAVGQRERAENLNTALESSRRIGAAVGILMYSNHLTYESAFAALTGASNRRQQKVRDLAEEVILTGQLPAS